MQVKRVVPSGFCKGVIRAVQIARKAREDHPDEDIYVLGMIVHNHFVTEALERYKIVTLDCDRYDKEELIGQLDHGILILTAHGTPQKLKDLAIERGLTVIDAACSDVIKTQEIIKEVMISYISASAIIPKPWQYWLWMNISSLLKPQTI